ncbi:hypothetical protein DPMN_141295 [Dreissena polymorpha]|uniref:Uncharacterized protein n=1 Tax=Dreissena polymorpha TaxID=45954 RepID=A0A9D4JJS2_DREPO|nr:hypothetical protein DPMN_141295 [Dreissena polymorpha]
MRGEAPLRAHACSLEFTMPSHRSNRVRPCIRCCCPKKNRRPNKRSRLKVEKCEPCSVKKEFDACL